MRPMRVVAHCMPIYVHAASEQSWERAVERHVVGTHIVEHLCCEQRESSPGGRPDHGIDSEGRRGIHSRDARVSILTIKSPIACRNSQICVHKVVLQKTKVEISMCKRSGSQCS
jgi:hypothetical protein